TIFFASIAFGPLPAGQTSDRVLYFTHADTPQQFQEIATAIRAVGDIKPISVDSSQRALILRTTADQLRLADWLLKELDLNPAEPPSSASADVYRMSGPADNVVRVFRLVNAGNPQELQEIATAVRAVTGIPRLFIYNAPKLLAVRGTEDQMGLAEWLVKELDQPEDGSSVREYRIRGGSDDLARVFYLAHRSRPQEIHELLATIRTTTGIDRMFAVSARKAVTLRATPQQIAAAERLIQELDKPAR